MAIGVFGVFGLPAVFLGLVGLPITLAKRKRENEDEEMMDGG